MGITINDKLQLSTFKAVCSYISENYYTNNGWLYTIIKKSIYKISPYIYSFLYFKDFKRIYKIVEEFQSSNVKNIISFPKHGLLKYDNTVISYFVYTSNQPLCPGQSDQIDYYKEIRFSCDNENFNWNEFIIHIYENYSKIKLNNINNTIPSYYWDFTWEIDNYLPIKKIDNIFLPTNVIENVSNKIDVFFDNSEKYKTLGVPHCNIFMFHGIPGTGKSSFIYALASKYNKGIAHFDFNKNINDKNMKEAFEKVPENSILVIEDIDCLFESRKQHDEYKNNVTFSGLLNVFDGIKTVDNLLIFITTNHIEKLDHALKRRIHHFIKFDYATNEQKKAMILRYFPNTNNNDIYSFCKIKTTMNVLQKFLIQSLDFDKINNIDDFESFNDYYTTDENLEILYN